MIEPVLLLNDTKRLVKLLVDDIREHAVVDPAGAAVLDEQHEAAKRAGRTAFGQGGMGRRAVLAGRGRLGARVRVRPVL